MSSLESGASSLSSFHESQVRPRLSALEEELDAQASKSQPKTKYQPKSTQIGFDPVDTGINSGDGTKSSSNASRSNSSKVMSIPSSSSLSSSVLSTRSPVQFPRREPSESGSEFELHSCGSVGDSQLTSRVLGALSDVQSSSVMSKSNGSRTIAVSPSPTKDKAQGTPVEKAKPTTKAERRALQEAQRAAKAAKPGGSSSSKPSAVNTSQSNPSTKQAVSTGKPKTAVTGDKGGAASNSNNIDSDTMAGNSSVSFDPQVQKVKEQQIIQRTPSSKPVPLFSHLPQWEHENSYSLTKRQENSAAALHPSVIKIGLKYAEGTIVGANARTIAMLHAFKDFIRDYKTPTEKTLSRDLEVQLKPQIQFLVDCRPLSVGMGNAIKFLKTRISKSELRDSEMEAKKKLLLCIDNYIQESIILADRVIADMAADRIVDGDVILTYARSHVVEQTLIKAVQDGKKFRVIVSDSRPRYEGRTLLHHLLQHGVSCSYILCNSASYVIGDVTKVYIGAHALLSNGAVMSRVGTASIAMMAHASRIPVVVLCETYKFCERVHLDSICSNELGDPEELVVSGGGTFPGGLSRTSSFGGQLTDSSRTMGPLEDWREIPKLRLLNLVYDVTPMNFVLAIITEVGMVPPTSVPAIIREYHKEKLMT